MASSKDNAANAEEMTVEKNKDNAANAEEMAVEKNKELDSTDTSDVESQETDPGTKDTKAGSPSAGVAEVLSGPLSDLEKKVIEFPVEHIKTGAYTKELSDTELNSLVEHVRTTYGISDRIALNAVCELIRRGCAAKGTPASFSVEVYCPDEQVVTAVVKRDVERAVELICKGKINLRNLAQTLAPIIVRTGLRRKMVNPSVDMSGDLAKKINNRLLVRKEKPLSEFEKIGCASYAQSIPDLDKMCSSDRLSHLLAEDLELRSSANKGVNKGVGSQNKKQNNQSKNSKGDNNKGTKGGTKGKK